MADATLLMRLMATDSYHRKTAPQEHVHKLGGQTHHSLTL